MFSFISLMRFFGGCGSNACVEAHETPDGFAFVSTIPGNAGVVTYTPGEVVAFIDDVRAGKWDSLYKRALELS